ncbi:uncharacterized protein MONBRDRAFT_26275 [Monosiga brevicollis MX1]|uniref:N-acetylneuraminate lyase n=1 Tax=Monosiga brevicollis TaxID=81824 RepID=A9V1W3_MONBE|nr:uncharacterized protein MONBRDRAFT_26275 [Monosiga brevicollis MX1]EDQ88633.1 predicted protein [Monosiga brevicollis MX1]|eukprot:XP_001746737.1 hypothetical protein [Monosiga brevicollis MX1]
MMSHTAIAACLALALVGLVAGAQADVVQVRVQERWNSTWRAQALNQVPPMAVLHAPLTPFLDDGSWSLNISAIPSLAKRASEYGVTVIWTCGGMGQFYTLTVEERMKINEAWVEAAKPYGLYVIAHVGTTVLADAVTMAKHALSVGADAVASVPPYYQNPGSISELIEFFKPIVEAAYPLPLYYYHIPGSTGYSVKMQDLISQAEQSLPALLGIKYVDSDTLDWYNIVQSYNNSHVLMFAPEPKLQSFGLGIGRGTVLAEDFFAPTYLRMHQHFVRGNITAAQTEQAWKYSAMAVFSKYGGGSAERAVYRRIANVDLGPCRLPATNFDESNWPALQADLQAVGFFDQVPPAM